MVPADSNNLNTTYSGNLLVVIKAFSLKRRKEAISSNKSNAALLPVMDDGYILTRVSVTGEEQVVFTE